MHVCLSMYDLWGGFKSQSEKKEEGAWKVKGKKDLNMYSQ